MLSFFLSLSNRSRQMAAHLEFSSAWGFFLLKEEFFPAALTKCLFMWECWVSVNERVWSRTVLCEKCPEILTWIDFAASMETLCIPGTERLFFFFEVTWHQQQLSDTAAWLHESHLLIMKHGRYKGQRNSLTAEYHQE